MLTNLAILVFSLCLVVPVGIFNYYLLTGRYSRQITITVALLSAVCAGIGYYWMKTDGINTTDLLYLIEKSSPRAIAGGIIFGMGTLVFFTALIGAVSSR